MTKTLLVGLTIGANEESFVVSPQHASNDVTCNGSILTCSLLDNNNKNQFIHSFIHSFIIEASEHMWSIEFELNKQHNSDVVRLAQSLMSSGFSKLRICTLVGVCSKSLRSLYWGGREHEGCIKAFCFEHSVPHVHRIHMYLSGMAFFFVFLFFCNGSGD